MKAWFLPFLLGLLLLGGLFFPLAPVQAQAAPKDYTKTTEDGKYLLVMLAPDGGLADPALRQKYPQPGLYPNDGSATPVWTTGWDSWYQNLPDSQLYATPDGKYLVRVDRSNNLALAFYVIGVEVKRYSLVELVPTLAAPGVRPDWVTKAELDPIQKRFVVETTTDERLEFNTTTGQRLPGIGKPDSLPLVAGVIAIVLFAVPVAVIAYIGVRRQMLRKKASG